MHLAECRRCRGCESGRRTRVVVAVDGMTSLEQSLAPPPRHRQCRSRRDHAPRRDAAGCIVRMTTAGRPSTAVAVAAEDGERIVARAGDDGVEQLVLTRSQCAAHRRQIVPRCGGILWEFHLDLVSYSRCTVGANVAGLRGVHHQEGNFTVRLFDEEAPKTVENFVGLAEGTKEWTDPRTNQKVHPALLRRHHLPPRDRRLHDPGRRSAGPGHRRSRLQLRRRVPSQAPAQQGRASCRWPTAARTPTAASSSSRSGRRRTSTIATRCSARWSAGMDVVRKIGSTPTGDRDRPLKDIVIQSIKIERS